MLWKQTVLSMRNLRRQGEAREVFEQGSGRRRAKVTWAEGTLSEWRYVLVSSYR